MTIEYDNSQITSSQPQLVQNENIPSVNLIYTTTPHSFSEWWDGSVDTRNYIRHGSNYAQIIGGGARSLNRAHRTFTHVAPQLYKPQSHKSMARLDNNYNLDESWFNAAAEDLSNQWSNIEQKYQDGKISDKRLERLADRYKQRYENLAENRLSWDQKNHPYRYVQPHKPGDIAPALFALGLPLAIIGGINAGVSLAPYAWSILNNPVVQAWGTYNGIKNF